jgi:tetratricopeptide (TPR) repeat protein
VLGIGSSASGSGLLVAALLLALFGGVLGELLGARTLTNAAAALGAAVLALFFARLSAGDASGWLLQYMAESEQREMLQEFLESYYWPNRSPEPTTSLITDGPYLVDRAQLAWHMTGWGFVLTLVGVCASLGAAIRAWTGLGLVTLVVASALAAIAASTSPGVRAEWRHREGDALLAAGDTRGAIASYESALAIDPFLGHSRSFALKSSRAFYFTEGEDSPFGRLYLAEIELPLVADRPGRTTESLRLDQARRTLDVALRAESDGSPLQRSVLVHADRENARLLIQEGRGDYAAGEHPSGLAAFRQVLAREPSQLHVRFFIAHGMKELGLYSEAVAVLEDALRTLDHSSLRADLLCTIGDALQRSGDTLAARQAYQSCLDSDSLFNYRALLRVSGT